MPNFKKAIPHNTYKVRKLIYEVDIISKSVLNPKWQLNNTFKRPLSITESRFQRQVTVF
jgi:hypothetical protein